jgi:hypothetical protein
MPADPPEGPLDPSALETVRVYRLENASGFGPVPKEATLASVHAAAIRHHLRDLKIAPWLRSIVGRKSLVSTTTRLEDWVFGTMRLKDINDYTDSWLGRGCDLSVYAVPPPLLVVGDSEVMFWRGSFQGLSAGPAGRRHPSSLWPVMQGRIPEHDLVTLLQSVDFDAEPDIIERYRSADRTAGKRG